jgi:hypothetical protein
LHTVGVIISVFRIQINLLDRLAASTPIAAELRMQTLRTAPLHVRIASLCGLVQRAACLCDYCAWWCSSLVYSLALSCSIRAGGFLGFFFSALEQRQSYKRNRQARLKGEMRRRVWFSPTKVQLGLIVLSYVISFYLYHLFYN